ARWVSAVLVTVMSGTLLAQVVYRFVLERPLSWSEELARYAFVWLALLGASSGLRAGLHPGMDLLVARLPAPIRRVLDLFTTLAMGWLLWVLLDRGLDLARLNMRQLSPAMRLPMGIPDAAIPVASAIMLVHLAARLLAPGTRGQAQAAPHDRDEGVNV
ncbi:MAG TPA: TRAP transporter small permease, partial [Limnochorda sp.]